jgi:hypothetical protein
MAYVELAPFSTAGEFLENLKRAKVDGRISTPLVHLSSTWARILGKPEA